MEKQKRECIAVEISFNTDGDFYFDAAQAKRWLTDYKTDALIQYTRFTTDTEFGNSGNAYLIVSWDDGNTEQKSSAEKMVYDFLWAMFGCCIGSIPYFRLQYLIKDLYGMFLKASEFFCNKANEEKNYYDGLSGNYTGTDINIVRGFLKSEEEIAKLRTTYFYKED